MHIIDGALPNHFILIGTLATVGGVAIGLKSLSMDKIPTAALLSAVFFIAALINVPLGPSSIHLVMNGLAGLILGWGAFPALLIGLLLQALLFGFGGITVLGINCLNIALPAIIMHYGLRFCFHSIKSRKQAAVIGALAGGGSVLLTGLMVTLTLYLAGEAFFLTANLVLIAHIPIVIIEGVLSSFAVMLIIKVHPDLLSTKFRGYDPQTA